MKSARTISSRIQRPLLWASALIFLAISIACRPTPPAITRPPTTPTPRPTRTAIPDPPASTPTETLAPTSTPTPLPSVSVAIAIRPGPGFDQSPGSAVLSSKGDLSEINVNASAPFVGLVKSVQIQEGVCIGSGAIKYPLTNLVDGKSTTTISKALSSLLTGNLSLNLKPAPDSATLIGCGGIPRGTIVYFDPGKDEHQPGAAVLIAAEGRTEVSVQMVADSTARPAQIFEGACPNVLSVKYPLNNVVAGKSFTSVPIPLTDLLKGNSTISIRKSFAEANVFVACANLK